jgi:putative PIN family toxin of toxin-antitoxin system
VIVVLDTGAMVSALIYPDRAEGHILQTVLSGHGFAVSPALAAELGSVLARPKFARLGDRKTRQRAVQALVSHPSCLAVQPVLRLALVPNDPDDNYVVEAAVAAHARLLVASDKHLLALGQVPAPPAAAVIPIVAPRDALVRLVADAQEAGRDA